MIDPHIYFFALFCLLVCLLVRLFYVVCDCSMIILMHLLCVVPRHLQLPYALVEKY